MRTLTILAIEITAGILLVLVASNLSGQSSSPNCRNFYDKAIAEVQKFERGESSAATMYATVYMACMETK